MSLFASPPPARRPAEELLHDALELLVPIADLHYQRLLVALRAHPDGGGDSTDESTVAILADLLAFIGTLDRLRRLMPKLGGDASVRTARRLAGDVLKAYENARHHIEHLDRAVEELADEPVAALAMVSWFEVHSETRVALRFLIPGRLRVGMQPGARMPKAVRAPVDHVTAEIAGVPYDLTAAHDAVLELRDRLHRWSKQFGVSESLAEAAEGPVDDA